MSKYDRVTLNDGRKGTIVEVLAKGEAFIVDIDIVSSDGEKTWETIEVSKDEISL